MQVVANVNKMRVGPALGQGTVDCGAMCMPGSAEKVGELVDDAVSHGAKVCHKHSPTLILVYRCKTAQTALAFGQQILCMQGSMSDA